MHSILAIKGAAVLGCSPLRSLWIGENGTTAGAWWDMVPFIGKPIGAVNRWLNASFGNHDPDRPTVDRVNNRSWMGFAIFPGFFQNIADGMKFLIKEHMVPERADKLVFEVAPYLVISSTVLILGLIPMGAGIYGANPELSVLFAMAVFGIAPIGVFFGGWASNNKYTLIGGIRSAAQLTAYEIPLLLTLLSVAIFSGTLNIIESIHFQHSAGAWNIFLMPLGAALFLVTMIAEVERVPFDMPEAEAELVEGWWTEYGGMRFGMLFMAEYIRTYAACFLFTHFFLGGWHKKKVIQGGGVVDSVVIFRPNGQPHGLFAIQVEFDAASILTRQSDKAVVGLDAHIGHLKSAQAFGRLVGARGVAADLV